MTNLGCYYESITDYENMQKYYLMAIDYNVNALNNKKTFDKN